MAVCQCGTVKRVFLFNVTRGLSKSCGCHRSEVVTAMKITHGQSRRGQKTSEYAIWHSMVHRCTNPANPAWSNYGGRGITVCERWRSFENFYEDVGRRPDGLTLDRIDNSKGYEPGNTRWATQREQMRNMRLNRVLEFRGESRCVAEWADLVGIKASNIHNRLKHGWSIEDALTRVEHAGSKV